MLWAYGLNVLTFFAIWIGFSRFCEVVHLYGGIRSFFVVVNIIVLYLYICLLCLGYGGRQRVSLCIFNQNSGFSETHTKQKLRQNLI